MKLVDRDMQILTSLLNTNLEKSVDLYIELLFPDFFAVDTETDKNREQLRKGVKFLYCHKQTQLYH